MLDISKLERRWLKYKIKKILPYGLSIAAVSILGITVPWIVSLNTSSVSATSPKKNTLKIKTPLVPNTQHDENRMILEPSTQFIQSIVNEPILPTANMASSATPHVPPKNLNAQKVISETSPLSVPLEERLVKAPTPVIKSKVTSIKRDDSTFNIHEIEERFKENSNPNLGLYIAHYHYDHGNYSEAYNYALKTNAINNTMDESWLIFAKSLVKLGKEDQARKTLQLYISNSNSQSAKNYLDTLNKDSSK